MMTIKKKGKRWQAQVDMGKDYNGKRMQPRRTFDTKKEAEAWERQMKAKKGNYSDMTVAQFWDDVYIPYEADMVRAITLEVYQRNFDSLCRDSLGYLKLCDVKPLHIQNAMNRCKAYGSKRNLYTTMRQLLRKARAWKMVDTVATDGCDLPEHRRKPIQVADPAQLLDYLEAVRTYRPQVLAGVCCSMLGMRRSEVCGLQWSDFTWGEQVTVHIQRSVTMVKTGIDINPTKTEHSDRTLIIPGWLVEYLRPLRGVGWVVPVDPDSFSRAWKYSVKKAGLPWVTLKNLRHTVGTALVDSGASVTDVQNWLGHDLVTTTSKFYVQKTATSIERVSQIWDGIGHIRSHQICQNGQESCQG